MRKHYRFVFLLVLMSSCKGGKDNHNFPAETIKVTVPEELMVDYDKFFDEFKLIPLSNEEASTIGSIDRIIIHNDQFFILDKQTNSIKVFDNEGQFIRRIQKLGMGPGEYQELMDFSIDEENERLVLHSHRPYKLLYYSFDGNYISEEVIALYYNNIVHSQGYFLMINLLKENKHLVFVRDLRGGEVTEYLPIDRTERELNNNFGTKFPYSLKSKHTYVYFPFSNIIYKVVNGSLISAYNIDFGKNNLPELYFKSGLIEMEEYEKAIENKYGFMVANFRESKDYIVFTFGASNIVIYSKKRKESTVFNYANNTKEFLGFQNYFGHDGQYDNYLLGIIQPFNFLHQMDIYRKDPLEWEKVPAQLKSLGEAMTNQSNPILMMVKLKDPSI